MFERTLESVRTLKVNGVREGVCAVDCLGAIFFLSFCIDFFCSWVRHVGSLVGRCLEGERCHNLEGAWRVNGLSYRLVKSIYAV